MGIIYFVTGLAFIIVLVALLFSGEIKATRDRDPAAKSILQITLLYPGLHGIIFHRMAHGLWRLKIPLLPRALSQLSRFITGIEIHPGAVIGKGFFMDHGMGIVIGETTVIGDNVTLFQGVTLGGTGKEKGKRHPTIGNNVVVGTGAKVLGNIRVGDNSYIGANAVVIRDIPLNATVVGVPGHVTKQDGQKIDLMMDHVHVSDPIMQYVKELAKRIKSLEDQLDKDQNPKE